jgi:hypothetical protein
LYIDGHAVDLPAFNVADFDVEQEEGTLQFDCGESGCAKFLKASIHFTM